MAVKLSPGLCLRCKGRYWCGETCWVLEKQKNFQVVQKNLLNEKEFSGSAPPSVFVSWRNYPRISFAPVSLSFHESNAQYYDAPDRWFGLGMEEIVSMREKLLRSSVKVNVNEARNPSRQLLEFQDFVLSKKPVEVEVELEKIPETQVSFSDSFAPIGPMAPLKNFSLTENAPADARVEKIVSDTDLLAINGIGLLHEKGFGENFITRLFSSGLLGEQKNRKFVPTRYAITAIDSNISESLIEEIKDYPTIDTYKLFMCNYLGNYFFVLLFPTKWSFESLECWLPGGLWTEKAKKFYIIQDNEFYSRRKNYAGNVGGAYYAARLAVLEYLKKIKKQATVIVFREITPEYSLGLGVWVIRETIRKALTENPIDFDDITPAFEYIEQKLKVPLKFWNKESKLLDFLQNQKRIIDF